MKPPQPMQPFKIPEPRDQQFRPVGQAFSLTIEGAFVHVVATLPARCNGLIHDCQAEA